ncbi:Methylglutaconyl-CoA hydratase [Zea mays]|uniref:Methylglutaconyl-CoA hydratase n=1 Tax=Zea mays TaxID=4577 RepID=A0A1D6HEY2_MAIZE|nr:Methylglutaconyl-CoA hydratase [Zea mays]
MRSPRGLLTASGYLAGRHAPSPSVSTTGHNSLLARTFQILAQPESVRLQKHPAPNSGILELRLERPEVKNAINWDMMRMLRSAIEKIQADTTAKVVLVASSVPGAFSAGADLKALPIPTIAVIEGAALGGGLELALACDLRICGENAELGLPETSLAIIPGYTEPNQNYQSNLLPSAALYRAGGTQRLPRIIGRSRAKELIFTGRRCGAAEAVTMGLANYCVPAGEAYQKALDIACEITQKGPMGIRMAKKAINEGAEVADMSSALAIEGECYEQLLYTQDRVEALAAFAEKRKPVYTGK